MITAWRDAMRPLDPEVERVLGGWAHRLHRAFGDLLDRAAAPDEGAPDGLSGVSRRGAPDRLLPSEWLLATEVPELFLWRAAQRHQLHTALERRTEAAPEDAVLLFDTGPDQAGVPRLAHVALALAVSRAGRETWWGALADPGTLHRLDPADPTSWSAILAARWPRPFASDDVAAWQADPRVVSPLWVGEVPRTVPGVHVRIVEPLDDPAIRVRCRGRTLSLEPPSTALAARLLGGRWQALSTDGLRLVPGVDKGYRRRVHDRHGAWAIRHNRAPEALPVPAGAEVLAVGSRNLTTGILAADPSDWILRTLPRQGLDVEHRWPRPPGVGGILRAWYTSRGFLVLASNGEVFSVCADRPPTRVGTAVPETFGYLYGAFVVWRDVEVDRPTLQRLDEKHAPLHPLSAPRTPTAVLFQAHSPVPVGLRSEAGWRVGVVHDEQGTPLDVPDGHELLGWAWRPGARAHGWAVSHDPGTGRVHFAGEPDPTLPPLDPVVASPRYPSFQGIDGAGEIHVVNWTERTQRGPRGPLHHRVLRFERGPDAG